MDIFWGALAIAAVVLAILWLRRKKKISRGMQCWNCGADLSNLRLHVDSQRKSRCPKCGDEMDVTDTFQFPR